MDNKVPMIKFWKSSRSGKPDSPWRWSPSALVRFHLSSKGCFLSISRRSSCVRWWPLPQGRAFKVLGVWITAVWPYTEVVLREAACRWRQSCRRVFRLCADRTLSKPVNCSSRRCWLVPEADQTSPSSLKCTYGGVPFLLLGDRSEEQRQSALKGCSVLSRWMRSRRYCNSAWPDAKTQFDTGQRQLDHDWIVPALSMAWSLWRQRRLSATTVSRRHER